MKNRKKQKKVREIKWGKNATDQLYKAVVRYINEKGGTAVVIGGIAIVQESPLFKFNYGLMVRITGKKPEFPAPSHLQEEISKLKE